MQDFGLIKHSRNHQNRPPMLCAQIVELILQCPMGLRIMLRNINLGTLSHASNAKQMIGCQKNPVCFWQPWSMAGNVTNAELLFMRFFIEHDVALTASDHPGQLFKPCSPIQLSQLSVHVQDTNLL